MTASRPERIGPYRLEERLGAGGMGEVFLAYDERLDRRVAVKLIRPEAAGDGGARQRFRREARAAAGLSHPSVVQIYDILEWGEGDAIVMELVDGASLAALISGTAGAGPAGAPLEIPAVLRLAREIAAGLAAAHGRGVVHRDLKAENVMVTSGGHAKILDFGLAKRLSPAAGEESVLTREHTVMGTTRAMSPEQARGLPLDHRSDLFSFGTLLYELLAGRSPFPGEAPLEILTRICTDRQTPVGELRPEVPAALSGLVDRLLEKDPSRRPQSAGEVITELERIDDVLRQGTRAASGLEVTSGEATWVERPTALVESAAASDPAAPAPPRRRWALPAGTAARIAAGTAAVAVLAAAAVLLVLARRPPGEPLHVAVPAPAVAAPAAGAPRTELLAAGVRVALLRALSSLEGVAPLPPEQVDPVPGTPLALARATAADEVVTSRIECAAGACQVALSRLSGRDGSVLWTQGFAAPVDRPYLLAEAVESYLRRAYSGHRVRRGTPALQVRPEDYADYLRLRQAFEKEQQEELPPAALERLAAIRRRSPRFLEAFVFEAEVLQHRFQTRREPADLERATRLLAAARELAPADPRPLFTQLEVDLKRQELDRAEAVLRDLDRLQPGDPAVLVLRARLLDARGRGEEALAAIRAAVKRNPSWRNLHWQARLERRHGDSPAARRSLEELLRRFPDSTIGQANLADLELLTGSPQRAVELYGRLVREAPQTPLLANLGLAHMLLRRYAEAEERFRQALALSPRSPFIALNLADVLFLQGRRSDAEALYEDVIRLADEDPASGQWQLQTTRAQALAHLGRNAEAVAAAQQALRQAPDDPQAAYEVALVYAVVGDETSALFNARRALDGGVEPRWFTFPWFDPLRTALGPVRVSP